MEIHTQSKRTFRISFELHYADKNERSTYDSLASFYGPHNHVRKPTSSEPLHLESGTLTVIQVDPQSGPQEDSRVPLPRCVSHDPLMPLLALTIRAKTEGVLVAKKDFNLPKHGEIDTKNLYVVKACQSLTSRGYLKTQFSWQWYYYTLTPEGLDYLREWLHLPAEIVPATHIKQQRSHAPPRGMMGGDDRERRGGGRGGRERGDREGGYRRRDAGEKEGGAPGEFAPQL